MFGRRRLRALERATVTLHTKDGRTIAGVLLGAYRDVVALGHAVYLLESGGREELAGDVLVPLENVAFLQAGEPRQAARVAAVEGPGLLRILDGANEPIRRRRAAS